MTEFKLDTSGQVFVPCPVSWAPQAQSRVLWRDLDPFTQGYVEAMFASIAETVTSGWEPGDAEIPGFRDIAPETLARIMKDCARFQRGHLWKLDHKQPKSRKLSGGDSATLERRQGEAFWKHRQGCFPSSPFPPLQSYLGNNGLVYLRESDQ